MPLYQRDFDEAARYLRHGATLLQRHAMGTTAALREVLEETAQRLSPGASYAGDVAVEIAVLRTAAAQMQTVSPYVTEARAEILKAIAVLREGGA